MCFPCAPPIGLGKPIAVGPIAVAVVGPVSLLTWKTPRDHPPNLHGLVDKLSDSRSEDWGIESRRRCSEQAFANGHLRGGPSRAEHSRSPPCSPLGSPRRRYQKLPADFSTVATLSPRRFSSSPPPSLASSPAARIADPLRPDDRHRRRAFDTIASTAVAAAVYVPLAPPSQPPALPPPPFPPPPPPPPLPPPPCPRPPLLPPPSPPPCPCSLPPPSAFSLPAATATVRVVPFGQPLQWVSVGGGLSPKSSIWNKRLNVSCIWKACHSPPVHSDQASLA